jgi:putative transcriptional regulator
MSESITTNKTLASISGEHFAPGAIVELPAMRPMSDAEIEAAAASDPDAQPRTAAELRGARRVPRVKTMRRALGLTQEQFASRYQIPLGTLRDWEQGASEPDQTAKAYLKAIAGAPESVFTALQSAVNRPTVTRVEIT